MIRLPSNLQSLSETRLTYLAKAADRDLGEEIERVSKADARFRRVLETSLAVEAEQIRRAGL